MSIPDTSSNPFKFILSARDIGRLEALLSDPAASELTRTMLRAKLAQAQVKFGSDIPPDIVTIGSRVRISLTGRDAGEIMVGEDERLPAAGIARLDLASPLALALLGCRAGSNVVAPRADGFVETVQLISVDAQPEQQARSRDNVVIGFPARRRLRVVHELPEDPGPSAA
jgi:regulator of nucleoside diphosphate kinase